MLSTWRHHVNAKTLALSPMIAAVHASCNGKDAMRTGTAAVRTGFGPWFRCECNCRTSTNSDSPSPCSLDMRSQSWACQSPQLNGTWPTYTIVRSDRVVIHARSGCHHRRSSWYFSHPKPCQLVFFWTTACENYMSESPAVGLAHRPVH